MIINDLDIPNYEIVKEFVFDDLYIYIAIHSTKLGPALGGCRIMAYSNNMAALDDALRLSKGMSYKNSLAGLDFGGGKCVVNAPKATDEIMLCVGQAIEHFNGKYISAEDVGTTVDLMKIAATQTSHIASLGNIGDPSPYTVDGLYSCLLTIKNRLGYEPNVHIEGLGKIGLYLLNIMNEYYFTAAHIYVSDIDKAKVDKVMNLYNVSEYNADAKIDIYIPCAVGNVINKNNVNSIEVDVICGSANNQLETEDLAEILHKRNIIYCPDYLVNSGGVIAMANELSGIDTDVKHAISARSEILDNILVISEHMDICPLSVANAMAEIRIKNR